MLNTLDSLAPRPANEGGVEGILYRPIESEPYMSDNEPEGEDVDGDWDVLHFKDFVPGDVVPLMAIDCGIIRLGETENGLVIALRAAVVIQREARYSLKLFRTGPVYLRNEDKPTILHLLGDQLGAPGFYVDLDSGGRPIRVKAGYAEDSHQFGDRLRNWFERKIQRLAMTEIENGIILLDGALTLRTRDTPAGYIHMLSRLAHEGGNALVGLSKQSRLQVYGRPFQFLLAPYTGRACYCRLSEVLRRASDEGQARVERTLGNMYACRFSPLGGTFRLDVSPVPGQTDEEVLNSLKASVQLRAGYPEILVQAHVFSYFAAPDVVQLQAQCATKHSFSPRPQQDISSAFVPFGGRFK